MRFSFVALKDADHLIPGLIAASNPKETLCALLSQYIRAPGLTPNKG